MRNPAMLTAAVCFFLLGFAEPPLADQFAAIQKEYEARDRQFHEELRAAARDRAKVVKANEDWNTFTQEHGNRLMMLIRQHPADPAVFDGVLVLVCTMHYPLPKDLVPLVLRLTAHPKMGELCFDLYYRTT